MEYHFVALVNDSVNRYGIKMLPQALVGMLIDRAGLGLPSLMSHDSLRPIGWSNIQAVYFRPGLTELVGYYLAPHNPGDFKLLSHLSNTYHLHIGEEHRAQFDELRVQLGEHLKEGLKEETSLAFKECVAFIQPGLAERVFSGVFSAADAKDKDGLFTWTVYIEDPDSDWAGSFQA